jgi:hypothetical protein
VFLALAGALFLAVVVAAIVGLIPRYGVFDPGRRVRVRDQLRGRRRTAARRPSLDPDDRLRGWALVAIFAVAVALSAAPVVGGVAAVVAIGALAAIVVWRLRLSRARHG